MTAPGRAAGPLAVLLALSSGCAHFQRVDGPADEPYGRSGAVAAEAGPNGPGVDSRGSDDDGRAREEEAIRAALPATPKDATTQPGTSARVRAQALGDAGFRVVVSTTDRTLWLLRDTTVLFRAPVAVGRSEDLVWAGRTYDFDTPPGVRKVLGKATAPLWTPPEWHYYELAVEHDLEPVHLKPGQKVELEDGTRIEVRGKEVGRVNQFGNFWPFTPGSEIMFYGKVYVPPYGTNQRSVPEILGTHKLELGDGYLIHGTNEADSIGDAVSHGCVRMYNEDVAWLYENVPVGTPVYIF